MGTQGRGPGTTVRGDGPRSAIPAEDGGRATKRMDAREAADVLGVSRRAVRNLVARGELEAERDGEGAAARVFVSAASVDKLLSERRGREAAGGETGD